MSQIKKITPMKPVEEVESHSSKWMKTRRSFKKILLAARVLRISVSPAQVNVVINYIANQQQHHIKKTSRMNTEAFLKSMEWSVMNNTFRNR